MLKKILVTILVLSVIAAAALFFLSQPDAQAKEVELEDKNSAIYSLLVAGGIKDALVDATQERVIVDYELPFSMDKQASWFYVMGSVAAVSSSSEMIVLQASQGGIASEKMTVKMADALDFLNNKTSEERFKGKMIVVSGG